MSGYIGKVKIGSDLALIGSTLYGICNSAADAAVKTVTTVDNNSGKFINNNFDEPIQGTTIHVKFVNGNTVESGLSLAVGSVIAKDIVGACKCSAGAIISFTLDENEHWVVNDSTEFVFKTPYNPTTNRILTESDIGPAALKDVDTAITLNSNSQNLPTTAAVATFVQEQTGGLSGLTGAMHFRGEVASEPTNDAASFADYISGDVVLYGAKEYVYVKGNTAADSQWIELGDEGSWALDNAVIHNSLLTAKGDMIFGAESGSNIIPARLPIGTGNNKFLTVSGGIPAWGAISKSDVDLDNVTNEAQIPKSVGTAAGDIIYYNGSTFVKLGIGTSGQVLKVNGTGNAPYWTADDNSDTKVAQTGITTAGEYSILLKNTTSVDDETNGVNFGKTTGKLVTINPSTGIITAAGFSGDGSSLTNVVASSVEWANVTNKVTAALNTLGIVKTTSTVSDATDYTASPIIDGVVYYQDTDTHYKSTGSANAVTSINLTYTTTTAQSDTISATATAIGMVDHGILYIKSISQSTTAVSTGVSIDNT